MHTRANTGSRCIALVAVALFVFQALMASSALAASGVASRKAGATTIICTASGPRVVTLDIEDEKRDGQQHSDALPHCCTVGCTMLGAAVLPKRLRLAWLLPTVMQPQATPLTVSAHFSSALARLQQQSRAPPSFA